MFQNHGKLPKFVDFILFIIYFFGGFGMSFQNYLFYDFLFF
jgi:hypothetical protein